MAFVEYAVRAIGLLYAAGAIFLIRQMALAEVLDRAISMISMTAEPGKQLVRRWLLGVGAALTGASGVAALLLSSWALPLFAINLLAQGGWLVWAAKAFPPEDPEDALGRRRTINAAFFYATMTVTVFALAYEGRLRPWNEWETAIPAAAATLAYFVYLARELRGVLGMNSGSSDLGDEDTERVLQDRVRHPSRIRFEVHPWRYPIVDADDGRLLSHFELLPDYEVAEDIEAWHDEFVDHVSEAGEGAANVFPSAEAEVAHRARGEKFVDYLRATYGRENVEGPIYLPRDETWEFADEGSAADPDAARRDAGSGN